MSKSEPLNRNSSAWVNVNVGGKIFPLKWRTIKKFKNTRLEKLYWASTDEERMSLCDEFDLEKREYFFDRHPKSFENVWNLLKSGQFYFDHEFCTANVISDLQYWGVFVNYMPFCCTYNMEKRKEGIDEELEKVKHIMKSLSITKPKSHGLISEIKSKIWNVMEHPETSIPARIIATISIFFIILSTMNLVLGTMQSTNDSEHHTIGTDIVSQTNVTTSASEKYRARVHDILECVCIGWFTFEYVLRLLSTSNRLNFLVQFLNIIDIVAIAPFYITILITNLLRSHRYDEQLESFTKIVQGFRVLRVLRVLKLARHSDGLQSLGFTLQESYKELGLLVSFIVIGVFLFSSLVYFAERETNQKMFGSIPHTFWWSIISMTTVGYGDVYPQTIAGQMFASVCCVSGVLVIALPIPIIVSNFSEFYKDKLRIEKTLKRHEDMEEATRVGNFVILSSIAEKTTTVLNSIMRGKDATLTDIPEIQDPWSLEDLKYMDNSSSSSGCSSCDY